MRMRSILLSLCFLVFSNHLLALEVNQVDRCEAGSALASSLTVFSLEQNTLTRWSHLGLHPEEFAPLTLGYKTELEPRSPMVCVECRPPRSNLVVKLSDWTRQHATGLEVKAFSGDISFGELAGVELEIKLHAQTSTIPSRAELTSRYQGLVAQALLDEVDKSNANLGVTVFARHPSSASVILNAQTIIALQPATQLDRWLSVFIPISEFELFTEDNDQRTAASLKTHKLVKLRGLRLVAETEHGQQLRNVMGEQWVPTLPETFKSLDISICRIGLRRNKST